MFVALGPPSKKDGYWVTKLKGWVAKLEEWVAKLEGQEAELEGWVVK